MDPYVSLHPRPKNPSSARICTNPVHPQPSGSHSFGSMIPFPCWSLGTSHEPQRNRLLWHHYMDRIKKILLQWHWLMFWDVWLMFQLHAVSRALIVALLISFCIFVASYIWTQRHFEMTHFHTISQYMCVPVAYCHNKKKEMDVYCLLWEKSECYSLGNIWIHTFNHFVTQRSNFHPLASCKP